MKKWKNDKNMKVTVVQCTVQCSGVDRSFMLALTTNWPAVISILNGKPDVVFVGNLLLSIQRTPRTRYVTAPSQPGPLHHYGQYTPQWQVWGRFTSSSGWPPSSTSNWVRSYFPGAALYRNQFVWLYDIIIDIKEYWKGLLLIMSLV